MTFVTIYKINAYYLIIIVQLPEYEACFVRVLSKFNVVNFIATC